MPIRSTDLLEIFEEILQEKTQKVCENCLSDLKPVKKKSYVYRCSSSKCRKQYNILEGTPFSKLRIPIEESLLILKMWFYDAKSIFIKEMLGYKTCKIIRRFLNKCFKCIENNFYNNFEKIGGKDIVIEIDESKFGKRKYNRGKHVEGVWIFGMVERTAERRIVLVPVDVRNKVTLESILKQYIDKKSTVISDCWKAYSQLSNIFEEHITVNHSKYFKDPITGAHTNTIEGNWRSVKSQTPITSRCRSRINVYLIKYMLKRNYPNSSLKNLIKLLF